MGKYISELTEEQKARMPFYVDKWVKIGLCTDPANKPEAERGVRRAYELAELAQPEIMWCDSPMQMLVPREVLKRTEKNKEAFEKRVQEIGKKEALMELKEEFKKDTKEWDKIREDVKNSVWDCAYGQHDASWLAFYDFFRTECGLVEETEKLEGLDIIAKNAGWFLPTPEICFISDRHSEIHKDESGRLHNENGPAVLFRDGWALYRVHGVQVPKLIIETPELITLEMIDKESNAEIKRIMMERFGWGRYLEESGAQVVDESKDQMGNPMRLLKKDLGQDFTEPVVMVELTNSTIEGLYNLNDMSFTPILNEKGEQYLKKYLFRVPPTIETAEEGLMWHVGIDDVKNTKIEFLAQS